MERRQKLIDELTKLTFNATVPAANEISEFIDTFLEGLKPGAGLIGQPDEYLDSDETDLGDPPAQHEGDGGEMGVAHSGPAPNDATSAETDNVDDNGAAGGAAVDDDVDIAMAAQNEGDGGEMGVAHLGPAPNDATSAQTGNVDDNDTAGGAAIDDDGDIAMNPADPDSESVGGDDNNAHLSGDFVKLPSGEYVAVWEYFGPNWAAKIVSIPYLFYVLC